MPRLEIISRQPTGTPNPTPLLFVHGAWQAAWSEIIPDMAHDIMLEPRWETAAARILAWLNTRNP
jgi:alpha-beta hydrolase superfamily lysophospholipase